MQADWFLEKTPLNEVQLEKTSCTSGQVNGRKKLKVQNLLKDLNEPNFPNILLTYSARTVVSCPSINLCFEFLESTYIYLKLITGNKEN